jgi:nucleoid-associated protein YgaU
MASQDGLASAEIKPIDPPGDGVKVLFNPTEYSFSKQLRWDRESVKGKNVAKLDFGGGEPASLTVQLFFDTYEERKDVRDHTEPIWSMTRIHPKTINPKNKRGRPPHVQFVWGNMWSFKAVIQSVSVRYTLFLPNGTPVRAVMDVTLQQILDEGLLPKQNPTSGGGPEVRRRTVRPRETLSWIAYDEYGDATQWRPIADANGLDNPLILLPGQELLIPPAE